MREESPRRPGALFSVPPVDVAAAMLPSRSSATAPTVSCEIVGSCDPGANRSLPSAFDFARDDQIFVLAKLNTMLGGEFLRTFGNEVDVRTLTENLARGAHWIAQ